MSYAENQMKFVAIANSKASIPEVLNGMGHAFIGLIGSATPAEVEEMKLLDYRFADGSIAAQLSTYPVIILQSRNSSQLQRLRKSADEAGVRCFVFVRGMLGNSAAEQLTATADHSIDGHDVIVACLWGEAAILDPMLKKFSCFRAPGPRTPVEAE